MCHSRTSRKRPPKMSSLGGRLRKVVASESSDHFAGQNFASLAYGNCREKTRNFSLRTFPSLVLPRNAMMLQHFIVQFSLCNLSIGRLLEVKNKRKLETFSSKSGRGRLREVVAYKRFQI